MSDLSSRLSKLSPEKLALLMEKLKRDGEQQPKIPLRKERDKYPLSYAQQRLWFLDQLDSDSSSYSVSATVRFKGELNLEVLERSIREVIHRHEVLRASFKPSDDGPIQAIDSEFEFIVPVINLDNLSKIDQESKVQQIAKEEAQQPFDLSRGNLLRITLLRLNRHEHVLVVNLHHIVADGWSLGIFIEEFSQLYSAFLKGASSPLPDLQIQYADFAQWQKEWFMGDVLDKQLSYWIEQLKDVSPILTVSTDRPRPSVQTHHGVRVPFTLPKALYQSLNKLSRQENVTMFMTLMAAFQTLLFRYTGQEKISVGTPIANRNHPGIEKLIGFFVNTLVMCVDFSGNPSFRELLGRVKEVAIGSYAHQDLPFEKLVDKLQPERDLSHSPLFQVMFVLQNAPVGSLALPGLDLSYQEIDSGTAKFDLTLSMEEGPEGLGGSLEYNTDLFDDSTMRRFLAHLQILLESIANHPDQKVNKLPLLTEDEQKLLLVEWNNTLVDYPQKKTLQKLFEEQAARTPQAIAVITDNEKLNYRDLNRRANQLSHFLQSHGIGPESLVGIYIERSVEMIIALLGILKAGGAYVPMDPSYPQERLSFMLTDSDISVVITTDKFIEKLPSRKVLLICMDADLDQIEKYPEDNLDFQISPDNLAYVIYTSGSTGRPKGTLITHEGLTNYLIWCFSTYPVGIGKKSLVHSSLSFDATVTSLFAPLVSGGAIQLLLEEDVEAVAEVISNNEADFGLLKITPAHLHLLGQQLGSKEAGGAAKAFVIGGENLVSEQISFWQQNAINTLLFNEYGPTETVVGCVVYQVPSGWGGTGSIPIGRPIPNTNVYILDYYLEPVPVGIPGELYIGGVGVARGYLNRPELTAEKFVPNPFDGRPGSRLYKSGDLARYLPNGILECLGRTDFQVKIRGYRIELGEIEAVLAQHPALKEVVVLARETKVDEKRLVAYLVPIETTKPKLSELRRYLSEKLPEYMVPSVFVWMDSLPLTPNGKIDRKALPEPEQTREDLEVAYAPPETPIEELLAHIWSEILGLDRIGIHDNFFELGGHSLLATQLISRIRNTFQVELPLRILFEATDISTLAERIETVQQEKRAIQLPPLEQVSRDEDLVLSFAQHRLWFLDQLEPGGFFYNIPSAIRMMGKLDLQSLESALNEIIKRHESLRTTFSGIKGVPIQVIAQEIYYVIPLIDLQNMQADRKEIEAQRLATGEAQKPFELDKGPLIRGTLLKLDTREYIFLFTMHHIISDGWSIEVLIRDLAHLYEAFLSGKSSSLPAMPIQFADFANWQKQWLQGEVLETQIEYWKEKLAGSPPVLELPTDHPRPAVQTFKGAHESLRIPKELYEKLNLLSRKEAATVFMTLLAAFQTLLYRYSGLNDILVGSPISGRNHAELENLIGFFVNTLVIRTDFSGNPNFRELLRRVREVCLEAYAHQDLPFEKLVEELQPARDLSHAPLFQVAFIHQNAPMHPLDLAGLTLSPVDFETGISKFDLTLTMIEEKENLLAFLEYNSDLFEEKTARRVLSHYQRLLENIVDNPEQPVSEVEIMTPEERQQKLVDWNATEADFPEDKCVHQWFESLTESHPEIPAVTFTPSLNKDESNIQLTYSELNKKANQLAHHLQKLGIEKEDKIGICVDRSLEMMIGIVGTLKAGGAFVPLDPGYPQDRLAYMIEDSNTKVLLTQESILGQLPPHHAKAVCLDSDWEQIAREPMENLPVDICPDNLAYVIYTSGSTGKPKGTMLHHRGLCNLSTAQQANFGVGVGSRILQFSSLSFDASVWETVMAILSGSTLCLAQQEDLVTGDGLKALFLRNKITTVTLPPSVLSVVPETDLPDLKTIIVAGEKCSGELVARWSKGRQFFDAYGPTETTVCASMHLCEGSYPQGPPIGVPIHNFKLYILDQNLQPVPTGVPGELHISGVGLARGYLNLPELSAEKFIPNPFSEEIGARMYKSGDLARYLPDGNIEFLGRIDFQVKIRGFRIELSEIEAVLSHYQSVQDVVMLAREDMAGDKRLVAYLVMEDDSSFSIGKIKSYLRGQLPEYMIPSAIVKLDTMPLTPNGKIDRKVLPAPKLDRKELESEFVAPRNPTEKQLAEIVKEILSINKVGIYDNFFELGGHSLLATQFMSRLRETFHVELPLRAVFETPTVADLATEIDKNRKTKKAELDKISEALEKIKELSGEEVEALLAEKSSLSNSSIKNE